jgi:hypothetical protein
MIQNECICKCNDFWCPYKIDQLMLPNHIFSKKEAVRTRTARLSVLVLFHIWNHCTNFHEIWYEWYAIRSGRFLHDLSRNYMGNLRIMYVTFISRTVSYREFFLRPDDAPYTELYGVQTSTVQPPAFQCQAPR